MLDKLTAAVLDAVNAGTDGSYKVMDADDFSAALQGEALILRGQLIQGAPGELEATEVAVAQLTLTREQGGGWQLASLTLS